MKFCQDSFWDTTLAWSDEPPHFTACFENTVLVYIPSIYIWGIGIIVLYGQRTWPRKKLPLNFIHILKVLASFILIGLYGAVIYTKFLITPVISFRLACLLRMGNIIFALLMQIVNRNRAKRSCTFLFTFWILLTLCELPQYYETLLAVLGSHRQSHLPHPDSATFIITMIIYPVIIAQLILASINESVPSSMKISEEDSPMKSASPMSKLFFEWMTPLIMRGFKRPLTIGNLHACPKKLYCERNYRRWRDNVYTEIAQRGKRPTLVMSLFSANILPFTVSCILEIAFIILRVSPALLLNEMIMYMSSMQPQWKGYVYVLALFLMSTISSLMIRHADCIMIALGIRVKATLISAIYRKSLKISSASLGKYTVGELVNLLSVDADKVNQLSAYLGILVGAPVNIIYATYLLYIFLGPSCFAGIAVIIIMMPITTFVAKRCRMLQEKQMSLKDMRLKYMSEILSSMKIIKFYAWERPFMHRVEDVRKEENAILTKFAYYTAVMRFLWSATPFFVSLFAFATYVLVNGLIVLDANTAFVSLSLFNGMRFALSIIPDLVSNIIQTMVSVRRIERFLACDELNEDAVGDRPKEGEAITVSNATMSWKPSGSPVLKNIDFHVNVGQLVAVVGRVGSGKSSLLQSLLGDLYIQEGTVNVQGTMAYVPQQAWIQNATVKQNIVFTKHYDKRIYNKTVKKCCLSRDLEMLPGGENTEIGEKGVNLSGGQKQRISLARAVYQDKDLYLLDDPLSAVDSHVGSDIFNNIIGPKGMLRLKTRILVTNNLSRLSEVDYIYVVDNGNIVQNGSYTELVMMGGPFAELLKEHAKEEEQEKMGAEQLQRQFSKPIMERTLSFQSDLNESIVVQKDFQLIDTEFMQKGGVKLEIYINYLKNIGIYFLPIILVGFGGARAFEISSGLWLSAWGNDDPEGTISERNFRIIIYAVLGMGYGLFSFLGTAALAKGTILASRKLHNRMLNCVLHAPVSFFDTTPLGRILNRFGKDVDQLDIQLPLMANMFLELFFMLIGMFILVSVQMPIFLAIAIPLMVIYYIVQKIYLSTLRQLKRLESVTRSPVYNHFSETISGLTSIRAYNVQSAFIGQSDDKTDTTNNCSFLLMTSRMWMTTRLDTIGNIIALVINALVISQRGSMDAGVAGFIISYTFSTAYAFNFLVHYASEVETAIVASERLNEYSIITPEAPWENDSCKPSSEWPEKGTIEFNEYSTRYRPGLELVLRSIDLQIKPCEKIGVVGRTGAGKSSLTLSLFRIIEGTSGNIVIDEVDISRIGLHDLRSRLTIIPQDPVLFSGTLRLNLDPHDEYKDDELWRALERAHVRDQFPQGLETDIAEGGANLSVGQRQLVCLARAILRKKRILIMDEATAAVDIETDNLIQETIRRDFADCTILTIAHRLNTIIDSDRVIVMANGQIIEQGSPQALLENPDSEFSSMAKDAGITTSPSREVQSE